TTGGWSASGATALKDGLAALDRIAPYIFNILCVPAAAGMDDTVYSKAAQFCLDKRAFLIVDVPSGVVTVKDMTDWLAAHGAPHTNAAVYFPRLEISDPLNEN